MWDFVKNRLTLCHGTMVSIPPPAFIDAAAGAGFTQVSLRVLTPKANTPGKVMGDFPLSGDTPMRRETKTRLDATGVRLTESEVAVFGPGTKAAEFTPYLDSSAYLGAAGAIPLFFGQTSEAEIVEQLGSFAALAASCGLKGFVEFIALSAVKSIGDAERVIRKTGAPNLQIIVDTLHWTRSNGTIEDIRAIDPALIRAAQINDGKRDFPNEGMNWWEEMAAKRYFLGAGDFNNAGMLRALPEDCPVGIEVLSKAFQERGLSPAEMAAYAMDNARAYFSNMTENVT